MSLLAPQFSRRTDAALHPKIVPDNRQYVRFQIPLLGRFMRENKLEYPCRVNDISVGNAALSSPVMVRPQEKIVAYFDHLGGIEGNVERTFTGGFAMRFAITPARREKLAAQLMWLINREDLGLPDERRHERQIVLNKTTTLKISDSIVIEVRMIDLSLSGASIMTEARPHLGSEVVLGTLRARVMRHHEQGLGLQFLNIQDQESLKRHFG
jgi:hypothetical protein